MSSSLIHFADKGIWQSEEFLADGTFNVPAGVNGVILVGCGGGGGGGAAGAGLIAALDGSKGNDTIFGSESLRGGDGGAHSNSGAIEEFAVYPHGGGHGISASIGFIPAPGKSSDQAAGGAAGTVSGGGGAGPFGVGADGRGGTGSGNSAAANSGGGGGGGAASGAGGQGGAGAPLVVRPVIVTPGASISVTIGSGGAGGANQQVGGNGGSGRLTVYWIDPN